MSGNSLGESEDSRAAEVAKACKRLRELCTHLRRGEDDSGLQSDCDESMHLVVNSGESEVRSPDIRSLAIRRVNVKTEAGIELSHRFWHGRSKEKSHRKPK